MGFAAASWLGLVKGESEDTKESYW